MRLSALLPLTAESGQLGYTRMAQWVEGDGNLKQELAQAGVTDGPTLRINIGAMSSNAEAFCE